MNTPKKIFRVISALVFFTFLMPMPSSGQADTVKRLKNTIRYNISNPVLFSWKFNVIGYERVIKDYQTASVNIGMTAFPTFTFMADSLGLRDQYNDKGINLSLDYRFYLRKENRYLAPRGIYIGPYASFNSFSRDIDWDLDTETFTGQVKTGFDIYGYFLGAQLGYQFVFWDRLTLDLILMGPGLWHFNLKTKFNTDLSASDEELLLETLNNLIQEKFPGSDIILTGKGFETSKNSTTNTVGFRYMVNLGFRF